MGRYGVTAPTSPPELLRLIRVSRRKPAPAEQDGAAAPSRNFRFFDNRQKYLLFVNTCSEKEVIARRVGMELAHIHPRPPAVRVFDADMGDGTVLTRVMREMHRRFPTMPFYFVAKEISLEDLRLSLDKMADRLFEHGHGAGCHQHVLLGVALARAQIGECGDLSALARSSAHRHHIA